jgi:predicted dehydrogenase
VHGEYLQDWLLETTDFSWRLEPDKGGQSSAIGDIGSHWCDLIEHVTGARIQSLLSDLTTVIQTRLKPEGSTEAFAKADTQKSREVKIAAEDLATVLLRFDNGMKGCVSVGQVCAGHKNGLWFEVNGKKSSLRWFQERQNELWIGKRHEANQMLPKDPSLLSGTAQRYAHLPGGHQEGWPDAFCNVLRDVYQAVLDGKVPSAGKASFPTFEDGYRSACIVEAILKSHANGNTWTTV